MSQFAEKLTKAGRVLTLGFGDRVAIGIFLGLLIDVTPEEAYDYIKNNHSHIDELSEEDWDWEGFRHYARDLNLKVPDVEQVIKLLGRERVDLASIIINSEGGRDWLRQELEKVKMKLHSD